MYEFLKYDLSEGVCTITFNRPEFYNAFNDGISYEFQNALKSAAKDEAVRVVVITGEGKAFCSGQDLKSARDDDDKMFYNSLEKRYNPIIRSMRSLPKPIIARLNGVAAGAGCSLALAADMIVAAESAKMVEVFINIGLVPDSGSSFFLPNLVGYQKAFELCAMGTKVSAREAFELGIINKVVPDEELDEAVKSYTDYFAKAPTKSIGMIKKMLNKASSSSLDEMLEYEKYSQQIAGTSDDYKEGKQAFLDKRKPEFKGV
ncbi:enoyl-CoA hydratase/isomerase family protein [Marivirga sp. S37H4]|uniref:Enoyl-CoA hydratase/isomerase family protein n=1 Tax=Marivirga aurantiaca TaxID=2802615 RepID=A0A934WX17_9BACT|nr:enoyl-CoA hydratase-related protein [Marivirga aurantiaca]MBK6264678.1 enoyl-CoA hydratase/isomerase family protein [Marivirga aurantiaca]